MHPSRLLREWVEEVRAASKRDPDFSRTTDCALPRVLPLACIHEPVAPATGEQLSSAKQNSSSMPAVTTDKTRGGVRRGDKPSK